MKLWVGSAVKSSMYPEIPSGKNATFGERYVSYQQLFSMLELDFGIAYLPENFATRIAIYREKIAACDNNDRFFHSSFAIDPVGVTKTLLRWRDELCLAGARDLSCFSKAQSGRLRDLAEVEKSGPVLPPGEAERIEKLTNALARGISGIQEIILLDDEAVLPQIYRTFLQALREIGIAIKVFEPELSYASGNLGVLQKALSSAVSSKVGAPDATLEIVAIESDAVAAELLSRYIQSAAEVNRLVIDEYASSVLDLVAAHNGLPQQGFGESSALRPVLQLLPVFLSLFWKPLNVYRLLDFLLMPVSPIPKKLRHRLADAVSEQPGIGGRKWSLAMSQASEEESRTVAEFLEIERFPEKTGVPVGYLAERCRKLGQWARQKAHAEPQRTESQQLLVLAGQIAELVLLLEKHSQKCIPRNELEKLLSLVADAGIEVPGEFAQAGKINLITDPANILGPVDELIWFNFCGEELWASAPSHWFAQELEEINALGVRLPDRDMRTRIKSQAAMRAVRFVRKRLILIVPKNRTGGATTMHPLYELAEGRIANWKSLVSREDRPISGAFASVPLEPQPLREFPAPSRFWQLAGSVTLGRERTESFSSLSHLFFYPYIYVLRNIADLNSTSLATVSEGALLLGNLAHELIERCLTGTIALTNLDYDSVRKAIATEAAGFFEREGAVFLMPGEAGARENLIHWVTRSVIRLKQILAENGYTEIETEKKIEREFMGGHLKGYIDLLAARKGRNPVIIDLKWGGLDKRRQELVDNDALQLLIYSFLAKEKTWPDYAYFIISRAELLAARDNFAGVTGLTPAGSESPQSLWKKVEATFAFRKKQLASGLIEVPLGELNSDEALPEDGTLLPMKDDAESYNEYGVLTGQEVR